MLKKSLLKHQDSEDSWCFNCPVVFLSNVSLWYATCRIEDVPESVERISWDGYVKSRNPFKKILKRRIYQDFSRIFWANSIFCLGGGKQLSGYGWTYHWYSKTWIPTSRMFGSSAEPARWVKSDRVESTKVVLEYYDPSIRLVEVPVRADIFWLAQKMILKIPETCVCMVKYSKGRRVWWSTMVGPLLKHRWLVPQWHDQRRTQLKMPPVDQLEEE
jgi:hypothetical protein